MTESTEEYFVLNTDQPLKDYCSIDFRGGSRGVSDSEGSGGGVDRNNDCADESISGDSATVDDTKGLMISWGNYLGDRTFLTDFSFCFLYDISEHIDNAVL